MKCGYHPEREAVGVCVGCGRGICEFCKTILDDKFYCPPCVDTRMTNPVNPQRSIISEQVTDKQVEAHINTNASISGKRKVGICGICSKEVEEGVVNASQFNGVWVCGTGCFMKMCIKRNRLTPGDWEALKYKQKLWEDNARSQSQPQPHSQTQTAHINIEPVKESFKTENAPISAANCPYCNVILIPAPKSKKKCPSCGKDIYVRTDPFNRQQLFLGQEDALSLDIIKQLHIGEKELQEFGKGVQSPRSLSDCVWGFLNWKKHNLAHKGDWQGISQITFAQARIQYTLGHSYFHLLQAAMREQLEGARASGMMYAKVLTAGDDRTCRRCGGFTGKIFTIKEALETMPLPVKCDNDEKWCRCMYLYGRDIKDFK